MILVAFLRVLLSEILQSLREEFLFACQHIARITGSDTVPIEQTGKCYTCQRYTSSRKQNAAVHF